MPYAAKLYIYLFFAELLIVLAAALWLRHLPGVVWMSIGAVYIVAVISFGRWLFGRKEL